MTTITQDTNFDFLAGYASRLIENNITSNLSPDINLFKNKEYKLDIGIIFSGKLSNIFYIGGIAYQLKVENNNIALYTAQGSIFHGLRNIKSCDTKITELFIITPSQKLEKKWVYNIGNYSCSRFSPMQLQNYITKNVSSFYKVILDNPTDFPNGVVKSKFDNSLIVNTKNGGFIKLWEVTENKPVLILTPIKEARSRIYNFLSTQLGLLDQGIQKKVIEFNCLKNTNQQKISNHQQLTNNLYKDSSKNLDHYENDLKNQLTELKVNFKRKLNTKINLYTENYCIENNLLVHLLPYDSQYLIGIENLKNDVNLEKIKAIRELKNNHIFTVESNRLDDYRKKLENDHLLYSQDLIAEEKAKLSLIKGYQKRLNELKSIDIDKMLSTIEKKVNTNNHLIQTLDRQTAIRYKNTENKVKKLTNNQLKRSITRTINQLVEANSPRKLKLIGDIQDLDLIVNTAKVNTDSNYYPYILSSQLSDYEYKTYNNQWLHTLNLTLIDC